MRISSHILVTVTLLVTVSCSVSEQQSSHTCPNWSSNPMHNYQNKDFSNFGCAYYNNVTAQVVNPEDLQNGHGKNMENGDRESAVLQKYMAGAQQTVTSASTTSSSR